MAFKSRTLTATHVTALLSKAYLANYVLPSILFSTVEEQTLQGSV